MSYFYYRKKAIIENTYSKYIIEINPVFSKFLNIEHNAIGLNEHSVHVIVDNTSFKTILDTICKYRIPCIVRPSATIGKYVVLFFNTILKGIPVIYTAYTALDRDNKSITYLHYLCTRSDNFKPSASDFKLRLSNGAIDINLYFARDLLPEHLKPIILMSELSE